MNCPFASGSSGESRKRLPLPISLLWVTWTRCAHLVRGNTIELCNTEVLLAEAHHRFVQTLPRVPQGFEEIAPECGCGRRPAFVLLSLGDFLVACTLAA